MAKIAKGGFSRAAMDETQHLIEKPHAEVREVMKWRVEFPGHGMVKAAIERHPAMVYENQTDGCLACHNGTAKIPRARWRCKSTGAPPQVRRKQPTPEQMPPPPRTPPAPSGDKNCAQSSQIANMLAGYEYKHAPLPGTQSFHHDTYAENSEHDEYFIPDLRNDKATSTG